jgi:putative ABC transport system permease protein
MTVQRWLRVVRLRLRTLFRRAEVEAELDEELRYHVDRQIEENVARGMTRDQARIAALRDFGGVEYRKEQVRDTRGMGWIEGTWRDTRLAARTLRRNPGFTTAVVLTLALGIGANTAMFTMLRGTLLRPLPNHGGDRLVYLRLSAPGAGDENAGFSVPEVGDYRAGATTLAAIAEYSSAVPFILVGRDGHPERVHVAVVSGNYFDVVGLAPVLGRVTSAHDDGAAVEPVAVLSYGFWMQHFAGDPTVVGSTVDLNEKVTTIVGVMEPAPQYPAPTDIYVNTVTSPHHLSATMVTMRTHRMTEIFARLAPGSTLEQARAEITRISRRMFDDHPEAYQKAARFTVDVSLLRDAENARANVTFWLLMGAAAFVLAIAGANVSNLTLMRGVERSREMMVRVALGAGRGRLRRLLLIENLGLALMGGALGVLVAFAGLRLLVEFAAQFSPRAGEIRVDAVVLGAALATSVVVAVALSFIPAPGTEPGRGLTLAPADRGPTLGRAKRRVQQVLVVGQIGATMVLLSGAGLLVRTLAKLQAVDTGVRVDHVLTLDLPLGGDLLRMVMDQPGNLANYERIRDRVAALPGVEGVTLGSAAPLRGSIMAFDMKADGYPLDPERPTPRAELRTVDPGYFATAGIPLVAGRGFDGTDRWGTARVAILSESFARRLFGTDDPLGRRVAPTGEVLKVTPFSGDWRTVVGVVADTRDHGLDEDVTAAMYEPFAQEFIVAATLVVRTTLDPAVLRPTIVRAVHEVAPDQLIERVATLEQVRDQTVGPRRLDAVFIVSFGVLAMLIAMVGIAGVLGFSVSSRTAEIGIRMSFGAKASNVHRMVLREGGVLLAVGVVLGSAGALVATRFLRGLLFGVAPDDPGTLGAVALFLVAVGMAACWLPAARAAQVDPARALRGE